MKTSWSAPSGRKTWGKVPGLDEPRATVREVACCALAALALAGCTEKLDIGPIVDPACESYEYRGTTYDCSKLDRCNEDDFGYRLACCECSPILCDPDPRCEPEPQGDPQASSCMKCHNGSDREDYAGPGLSNPHPFLSSTYLPCVTCHGGNAQGAGKFDSHVPPPPAIGDRLYMANDPFAYFNRLTLTGIDKLADYVVDGKTYSALEYLQFVNPGDLRVVSRNRSCGAAGCHGEHAEWVNRAPLATETGFYSATLYASGVPNALGLSWYSNTAADYGFRAVEDPGFVYNGEEIGRVGELLEYPENAQYANMAGIYQNPLYDATQLANYVYPESVNDQYKNQIIPGSPLQTLLSEQIAITCGDCHLGSSGQNNRYGDFRSSGCTACHMEYSLDGRSRSTDPNVSKLEPQNADAIAAPERPHIDTHQIRNVAKTLPKGSFLRGITDRACVGCHQGSNRTVLQYWGIRLDQNQDLVNQLQYPDNPVRFTNTALDTRLYDPAVANQTFNGRNANQYILLEDYDGDNRDDTPADIHYERGLACIDCHHGRDLHGGTSNDPTSGRIWSREDQIIAVECESCHGGPDGPPPTTPCVTYRGENAECATDRLGNPLRNVTVDVNGEFWLRGRVDGDMHYVPLTRDTIVQNNKRHPLTGQLVYSPAASYAMGRADDTPGNGTGPLQGNPVLVTPGFSHTDKMECVSCHSSWSNNCIGCHLGTGYNANPASYFFSNTTGERIVLFQAAADFTYITPVPFFLAVGSRGRITQMTPGMKMFYRYDQDLNGNRSQVLAFTDRNGNGNNPLDDGRGAFPALAHNKIMPHSQRGRVDANNEGPRYCVACHLTQDALANFGAQYTQFFDAMRTGTIASLDFPLLQEQIGRNPGNQNNSPFFVHMAAGLGSGLFYFDANGCPVNPLDNNPNRQYCQNVAPAAQFNAANAVYALDRVVEITGVANASNGHPMLDGQPSPDRVGSLDPQLAGPLGATLLQKLADPATSLVLDGWIDANGQAHGTATNWVP